MVGVLCVCVQEEEQPEFVAEEEGEESDISDIEVGPTHPLTQCRVG